MIRRQAFQFELIVRGELFRDLRCFAGACRFVFNRALALQQERYQQGIPKLSYAGLCQELTRWKEHDETNWLAEMHAQILQQSLKDLERAYTHFFQKRAAAPRFKKRGVHDSFRFPQGCKLDQLNRRIWLPKMGWVQYRKSRQVVGTIKNVTVSSSNGRWFISVQTEREVESPVHPATSMVGIDLGITRFATLSDGTVFEPIHSLGNAQARLRHVQRALTRKQKFSLNWKKAKARIQRIHQTITHIRKDHLHKISHTISNNHAVVCLEDLQVKSMSASAAGTREEPGRNVKAKSGLNRAILDQGWSEFRRQLEYKQAWRGGWVIAVPPRHTSQTCPACGHVAAENRQTQSRFACVECRYEHHADLVGAMNIVRAGHAQFACGEMVHQGRSMKQEPTEARQTLIV